MSVLSSILMSSHSSRRGRRPRVPSAAPVAVASISGPVRHASGTRRTARRGTPSASQPFAFGGSSRSTWTPSTELQKLTNVTLLDAWAPKTREGHSAAVIRFRRFCIRERVPARERFPVTEEVICAFAAHRSGRVSGAAVRSDVAGVRALHIARGAPWPPTERLNCIIKGVEQRRPAASRRPPRPPVSIELLRGLHDSMDASSSRDAAIYTCAVVAFWGQLRLGELLPESLSAFSHRYHPCRSSWRPVSQKRLKIPWTKKTRSAGATISLPPQSSRTCPITALNTFVRRHPAPPTAHLFSYSHSDGSVRPLTKRVFLDAINRVATRLRLPRLTGHCFRIGGTTELLRRGVPPDVVKVAGRWSSDSFLRYWRREEEILPRHIRNIVVSHRPHWAGRAAR